MNHHYEYSQSKHDQVMGTRSKSRSHQNPAKSIWVSFRVLYPHLRQWCRTPSVTHAFGNLYPCPASALVCLLLSYNMMWSDVHLCRCAWRSLGIVVVIQYFVICIEHNLFIHSVINGHLASFGLNSSTINISAHVFGHQMHVLLLVYRIARL